MGVSETTPVGNRIGFTGERVRRYIPVTKPAILFVVCWRNERLVEQRESVFAEIAAFLIFAVGNQSTWCVGSFR